MTTHERLAPKIINGSRRARIAKGSGVHVSEVNGLLERFGQAQKMMKKMAQGGGIPGMPGMAGPGGFGGARKGGKSAPKKKARSGNPAKAAQELKDAEARRANAGKSVPTGAAFGQQGAEGFDPASLNLPKGFDKFLGK
jgi:signal recognition particle subunit SRP54